MVFGRAGGGIDVTCYLIEWCLSRDRSPSQTITIKSSLTKRGGNPNSRFRHFECMSVRGLQTPSFGSPQDRPPVSDDVTNQITGVLHSTESGRGGQSHVLCYFVWCRKVKKHPSKSNPWCSESGGEGDPHQHINEHSPNSTRISASTSTGADTRILELVYWHYI
jgi:hypothetical protein